MNSDIFINISLTVSCLIILFILFSLYSSKNKSKKQIRTVFIFNLFCELICCTGLLLQKNLSETLNIPAIYFDYFVYIGTCFLPVFFLLTGIIFIKTKINLKRDFLMLSVIPCISLFLLWTNDSHHLFYETYSTNINETVFGSYFTIHSIYSYVCIGISLLCLVSYSIKNSGFFSKQSVLISVGILIPTGINILATLGIVNLSIYITPISFSIALLLFAFAIFRFQFLSVAPIALQKIVDKISDSYIVINELNIITDFNQTFINTFKLNPLEIRNRNIFEITPLIGFDNHILNNSIIETKKDYNIAKLLKEIQLKNNFFNIEINSITSKNNYLGTLILFKDITQHINDLSIIQSNQDMLMEKERLASLGQLIGGIAHNLKTPIMSISGATEGLTDLINEYDSSIEDSEVTIKDHHDIANDMYNWVNKIRTHTSYMSDVITAVKGQAVAFSDEQSDSFTIDELLKRVTILMKHELKSALIELKIVNLVDINLELNGNVNSLVQVINNMISNAIQSYNNEPNNEITLSVSKKNKELIISISDNGCGMSKEVQQKLFREMITTKGKNGTGLGLFMSYSNIKGHFNGNITFESEENLGTTFNIILPLKK